MRADAVAMPLEEFASFGVRGRALFAQPGIANHLADGHAGGLEPPQEIDPCQDRPVVVALARTVAQCARNEPQLLVVADGVGGQSGAPCEFADLHEASVSSGRAGS